MPAVEPAAPARAGRADLRHGAQQSAHAWASGWRSSVVKPPAGWATAPGVGVGVGILTPPAAAAPSGPWPASAEALRRRVGVLQAAMLRPGRAARRRHVAHDAEAVRQCSHGSVAKRCTTQFSRQCGKCCRAFWPFEPVIVDVLAVIIIICRGLGHAPAAEGILVAHVTPSSSSSAGEIRGFLSDVGGYLRRGAGPDRLLFHASTRGHAVTGFERAVKLCCRSCNR